MVYRAITIIPDTYIMVIYFAASSLYLFLLLLCYILCIDDIAMFFILHIYLLVSF